MQNETGASVTRRGFIANSAAGLAVAGLPEWFVRDAAAAAREREYSGMKRIGPNDTIQIGAIGVGGSKGGYRQGLGDTHNAAGHPGTKVVAIAIWTRRIWRRQWRNLAPIAKATTISASCLPVEI